TLSLSRRAAISAASLTRNSRSAPENPGVPRARISRSTPPSGTLRVWTCRMPIRPRTSGRGTTMRRSKRPGRSSAGSSPAAREGDRAGRPGVLARAPARERGRAGGRRAHRPGALGDASAEPGGLLPILGERDGLLGPVLGFLDAGAVLERHAVLAIREQLG